MTTVCLLVGVAIQYFTGFYWLTAALLPIIALLINGLVIFNEDLEKDGFDYREGVTDTPEAKSEQRKANVIQAAIILLLIVGVVIHLTSCSGTPHPLKDAGSAGQPTLRFECSLAKRYGF